MNSSNNNLQIFIQAPDLKIPIRALTLTPNSKLHNLKQLFLSQIDTVHQTLAPSTFLTFNGRPLSDSGTVKSAGITNSSTLNLNFRLSGGRGDGGSTCAESRDCYLSMYAERKPDKVDPNEQRLWKWLNCALSNEPLKHPIVIDYLGNLFNKQALVEALLGKKLPKAFSHIKGLKDMIAVELESIPGKKPDSDVKNGGWIWVSDSRSPRFRLRCVRLRLIRVRMRSWWPDLQVHDWCRRFHGGGKVINLGPAFRGHYGNFTPNSLFPDLPFEVKGLNCESVVEDTDDKGKIENEKFGKLCDDQMFKIGRLKNLMGSNAAGYIDELEELYNSMIKKLNDLAKVVEQSSARVSRFGTREGK